MQKKNNKDQSARVRRSILVLTDKIYTMTKH